MSRNRFIVQNIIDTRYDKSRYIKRYVFYRSRTLNRRQHNSPFHGPEMLLMNANERVNERIFRSKSLKLKKQEPRPTLILNRWVLDGWAARYEWANTRIQSGRECQEFWRDCYWHQQCTNGFFTFWHFKDPWDITESGLTIHGIHKDTSYIHTATLKLN